MSLLRAPSANAVFGQTVSRFGWRARPGIYAGLNGRGNTTLSLPPPPLAAGEGKGKEKRAPLVPGINAGPSACLSPRNSVTENGTSEEAENHAANTYDTRIT